MISLSYQSITFVIGIMGMIFTVFLYFKNPQIKADKNDSLFIVRLNGFEKELANLRDNHIHSLDLKLDQTNIEIGKINVEVGKLATIIDERIPRKNG